MDSYVQALLFALALSGMAFGIGKLVVVMGERMIEKRHGIVGVRDMLVRRARLETALEARRQERIKEIKAADETAREVLERKRKLERQLSDIHSKGESLVRQIGEENTNTPCWQAEVVNKHVGTSTFQQKPHAYIDSSWAQAQPIEVWARSAAEARTEIERRYPPVFGFAITRLQEVATGDSENAASGKAG